MKETLCSAEAIYFQLKGMSQLPEAIQEILGMPLTRPLASLATAAAAAANASAITRDPTKNSRSSASGLQGSAKAENGLSNTSLQSDKTVVKSSTKVPPRPTHGPGKIVRVEADVASKKAKK